MRSPLERCEGCGSIFVTRHDVLRPARPRSYARRLGFSLERWHPECAAISIEKELRRLGQRALEAL